MRGLESLNVLEWISFYATMVLVVGGWNQLFSPEGIFSSDERINEIMRSVINIFWTQMYVVDAFRSGRIFTLFTPEAMEPIDLSDPFRFFLFVLVPVSVSAYNLMDLRKIWQKPAWNIVDKGFCVHHLAASLGVWLPTITQRFYPMTIAGCMMEWTSIAYNLREFIKIKLGHVPIVLEISYKLFYSIVRLAAIAVFFTHIDFQAHIIAWIVYILLSSALTLFSLGVIVQMWKPRKMKKIEKNV